MLVSLVLCLVALLVHEPRRNRLVPIWLPLVLLAVYLYFSARRESQRGDDEVGDDDLFGYDFSQGYTSLERPPAPRSHRGPLRRWLEQRRQIRQRRLRKWKRKKNAASMKYSFELNNSAKNRSLLRSNRCWSGLAPVTAIVCSRNSIAGEYLHKCRRISGIIRLSIAAGIFITSGTKSAVA